MEISAKVVMELREKTGVGMMQCKKALLESSGDINLAVEILRKKGEEGAAKRAGRAAKEGKIATKVEGSAASIIEVNSETDFVSRNSEFIDFVSKASDALTTAPCESVEALMTRKASNGLTLKDILAELSAKIGENMSVRRFCRTEFDPAKSAVFTYIHGGGKIGVLLQVDLDNGAQLGSADLQALGKDLTLQIAASNPLCVRREELPAALVEKEKEIYREKSRNEGKPEKILDKIVEGRMVKFYQETCLLEQPFVKEPDKTVTAVIAETEKKIGAKISVPRFVRYLLGGDM